MINLSCISIAECDIKPQQNSQIGKGKRISLSFLSAEKKFYLKKKERIIFYKYEYRKTTLYASYTSVTSDLM